VPDLPVGDFIASRLAIHLGPNVARMAVKTFSLKALSLKPEELTVGDLPSLTAAMRPMLTVMIGREPGEAVLREISREYGLG
jgi:hypothetical protein